MYIENNEIKVLDIPNNTQYWFVRANSQAQYYDDFLLNNYISVDSNKLSLKPLLEIPSTLRSSEDALLEKYKNIFQENDIKTFDTYAEKERLSDTVRKTEKAKELRKSKNRAKRVFHFVENLNIGDFVIVPFKSAEKFLIGTIVSDCFEHDIDHVKIPDDNNESTYDISNFEFKRKVLWIKELPRKNFPDNLSWIKTAHQSIFNITAYANDLNPFINPFYKYKNKFYSRIGVNTSDKISSTSWLEYQLALKVIVKDNLDNIYQKQKVQSPGEIILYVEQNFWWLLPLIIASLFGEIEISHDPVKLKMQGVIRYFSKGERLKRKLAVRDAQLNTEQKEADINNTNADSLSKLTTANSGPQITQEVENIKLQVAKSIEKSLVDRKKKNEQHIDQSFSEKTEEKSIDLPKDLDKIDTDKLQDNFKFSNEDPGSSIQFEIQKDNLILPEEEHEEEK